MSQQNGVLESLVIALAANTAALEANTAALGGAASAPEKTTSSKTTSSKTSKTKADDKPKSKYTKQEVSDAVVAVKDAHGAAKAKELLSGSGFAKLADITEDKFDELYENAQEILGASADDAQADDDI